MPLLSMMRIDGPLKEILSAFSSGYTLLCYILGSIGLYTLSRRRGYKSSWQAWVPFARSYALGNMADNISYCRGKQSRLRFWLLAADSLSVGVILFFITAIIAFGLLGLGLSSHPSWDFWDWMGWMFALFLIALAAYAVILILRTVVECIVYYRIFSDYSAGNAVGFLLLHIFFGAGPILLFALREKIPMTLYASAAPGTPPGPRW